MATRTISKAGGNWNATTAWVGGVVPTAADDVVATAESGSLTINVEAFCRSIDLSLYTKTLTHNAAVTLKIGDGTAGAGSIALKFVAGMTYTLGNTTTSQIIFVSTSETVQTVDFGGKTHGNLVFQGTGGSWKLVKETVGASLTATVVEVSRGTLDTNGQVCKWGIFRSTSGETRTLTFGASAITLGGAGGSVWNVSTANGLTITANTATVTMNGNAAGFTSASVDYNGMSLVQSGSGLATVSGGGGSVTVANYTRTGTAAKTDGVQCSGTFTVTGTMTITGNSAINRVLVRSAQVGVARLWTAAVVSLTNVDFMDVNAAGAAAPFSGTSIGDAQGNSEITFTTPVTRYWVATGGGLWSATSSWSASSGGASGASVPLPQDSVHLDAKSITASGKTVTLDMPRLGKDIDCTGLANNPTFAQSVAWTVYGSLTLVAGITLGAGSGPTFAGRETHTITTAAVTFTESIVFNGPTGKYTLLDALATSNTRVIQLLSGTLDFNGKNVTVGAFRVEGSMTQGLSVAGSTLTLNDTGTILDVSGGSLTITGGSELTVVIGTTATIARVISLGAKAIGTLTYTVAGSTASLRITHSGATIGTLNFSDATNARTLILNASQTLTITTAFNVQGTAGKLMTVESTSAGTQATLSKSSGLVQSDYLALKDSKATGGARWLAGTHSENVSGNSGWEFNVVPEVKKGAAANSASGSWTAAAGRDRYGKASLSGSGTSTATGSRIRKGAATSSASGDFEIDVHRVAGGRCDMSANTSVSDVGTRYRFARSQNSSSANWVAKSRAVRPATSDSTASGSIDADAVRRKRGSADLDGESAVDANGARWRVATVSAVAAGDFIANAERLRTGSADFEALAFMVLNAHVDGGYGHISEQSVGRATVSDEPVGSATLSQEP